MINEFAHACGVSRKTLIRMEESGFLKPYRINPETGYRYYDAQNASSVGQYLLLQKLGLSRAQITDCYFNTTNMKDFIHSQRTKLSLMQRTLEELEVRCDPSRNFSSSFLDLPEIVCYCKKELISSPEDSEKFFYSVQEQCMLEGYRLSGTEPLFGIKEDDFRKLTPDPATVTACIPVVSSEENYPNLVVFPETRAFSMLAYGDYRVLGQLCIRFWAEFEKRELKPTGHARFLGLVAPYVGNHIDYSDFCYRLLVPIEME